MYISKYTEIHNSEGCQTFHTHSERRRDNLDQIETFNSDGGIQCDYITGTLPYFEDFAVGTFDNKPDKHEEEELVAYCNSAGSCREYCRLAQDWVLGLSKELGEVKGCPEDSFQEVHGAL